MGDFYVMSHSYLTVLLMELSTCLAVNSGTVRGFR
jgi:hypothetical protein